MGFNVGSTWKPINMVAWMQKGHSINESLARHIHRLRHVEVQLQRLRFRRPVEGAEFRRRHHLSGKPAAGSDQVAQHHAGLDGVEHRPVRDRRRGQGDGLPQRHLQRVRHLLPLTRSSRQDHRYGAGVAVDHGQRVRHHGRQRRGMHSDRHHQGDRPQRQQGESAVRELPSGHRPGHRADRVLRAEPRCRAAWRRSVDHAA